MRLFAKLDGYCWGNLFGGKFGIVDVVVKKLEFDGGFDGKLNGEYEVVVGLKSDST